MAREVQNVTTRARVAKVLFAIIIAVLAWFFFFKKKPAPPSDAIGGNDGKGTGKLGNERVVLCAVCGVNIPESESVTRDGRTTCAEPDTCKQRPST
jgi:hypothetical protein